MDFPSELRMDVVEAKRTSGAPLISIHESGSVDSDLLTEVLS